MTAASDTTPDLTPLIDVAASSVASNLTPPTSHSDINTTAFAHRPQSTATVREVNVMYCNQMGPNYKHDERKFKNIINTHVIPANSINLNVLIYYKNRKIRNMVMKNKISNSPVTDANKSNVVYQYNCNLGECGSPDTTVSYIGMTTMTLRERFSNHRYQGSIHKHCVEIHGIRPKLDHLLDNTEILYQTQSKLDLPIFEALHIYNLRPKLNENLYDFFCLKLFHRRS